MYGGILGRQLHRFSKTNEEWNDEPQVVRLKDYAASCHILPSSCVLVAMRRMFSFFSAELSHVKDFMLSEIFDGLECIVYFKHLKYNESGNFLMIAMISSS